MTRAIFFVKKKGERRKEALKWGPIEGGLPSRAAHDQTWIKAGVLDQAPPSKRCRAGENRPKASGRE